MQKYAQILDLYNALNKGKYYWDSFSMFYSILCLEMLKYTLRNYILNGPVIFTPSISFPWDVE